MKAFDDEVSEDCSDYKAEDNAVEKKGVVECFTVMGSQKAVQILGCSRSSVADLAKAFDLNAAGKRGE